MVTTRQFILVLAISIVLAFGINVQAQWLTKADESHSAQLQRPSKEAREADAGIRDAETWFWGQRKFGLGYIPQNALQKAWIESDALRQTGKGMMPQADQPQWKLIGPSNIGGRIESVAIDPKNPAIVYAGAAGGGVWKTTDAGSDWVPLTDNQQSIAMGSLAIDPNNTNIVFAGTGEFPVSDSYTGYGLLRSSDGGKTWTNVGPTNVASYSRIIVNPKHSNLVYASAGRSGGGVLRSKDGGLTWQWLADSLPPNTSVSDLALSMNGDVAVLYAGIVGKGVYRSTDGGDTWRLLNIPSFTDMARISVDVDPTNWQNVVALSVTSQKGGNGQDDLEGIQVSNDGGDNWSDIATQFENGDPSQGPFYEAPSIPPQGTYDMYIRVDPSDFNHMILGGIYVWSTHDGGQSWTPYQGLHPDQHDVAFAPSNHKEVYFGNDGGVWHSGNGGDVIDGGIPFPIPVSEFYGIGIDQSQSDVTYGGLQDNGLVFGSSSSDWTQFQGGDGGYTVVDPNKPSRVYYTITEQMPLKWENGSTTQIASGINPSGKDYVSWLNPLVLDGKNNILYFGLDHLYISSNQGATWTRRNTWLAPDSGTSIQSIDYFGDKVTLLTGSSGGRVYVTSNNGLSWTNVSAGLPGRWVTCVKFDPTVKTTFYATLSGFGAGHVFKTTDNGAHWTNISSTLPDIPVNSLVMDPTNSSILYIGTDIGVFFSPNGGAQWMPYGQGFPNVAVDFLDIQKTNRVLRAGTHGRSIWEVPLVGDVTGIIIPSQRTVWTIGDTASIQWRGFGESVTVDLTLDGGKTWQNIASNLSSSSYKIANVTYQVSENAQVRISDGTHTLISPLFTIVQQRAGDQLATIGEIPFYLYDIGYDKDDNVLWGTDFNASDNKLYKIDPDNGTILGSVTVAINTANQAGLTGIKYDPRTKHLFVHQVINGASANTWSSWVYEIATDGTIIRSTQSPAEYGTGILPKGDTLLVIDRMGQGSNAGDIDLISRAAMLDLTFGDYNPITLTGSPEAIYGPRGLTYDPKLDQFLLAYTDFQGSLASSSLNGSYIFFVDPASGEIKNSLAIRQGGSEVANIRGMEFDPRGAGNTAWTTILSGAASAKLVKIALTDGPVSHEGVAPNANSLTFDVWPNPARDHVDVTFELDHSTVAEAKIFDVTGREVRSQPLGTISFGEHSVEIPTADLAGGIYFLRITGSNGEVGAARIAIER